MNRAKLLRRAALTTLPMLRTWTFMVATLSIASAAQWEQNTNRPAGDYKNFEVLSAEDCRSHCEEEDRCKAWTWVKKGVQGPAARCWLKASVPQPVPDKNCVSGTKGQRID
jgi:hypothetical protein